MTRLPQEIGFQENPRASDTNLEEKLLNPIEPGTLILLDRGFYHFQFWLNLKERGVEFVTRLKKGAAIQVEPIFTESYGLRVRVAAT